MNDYADLIWRLENGADRFLKWTYNEPYSGAPVISIPRHPDNIDALLTEAAACIRDMVERGERSVDYEIWQDGVLVAGSDNEADARHYAAVYEQDGPVDAFKVVSFRSPLPPAPGAEA